MKTILVLAVCGVAAVGRLGAADGYTLPAGLLAGEVTSHRAILQARLGAEAAAPDGDRPGREGWVRFELSPGGDFSAARATPWRRARAEDDFIVKEVVSGLEPGAEYHYRARFGATPATASASAPQRFRTPAAADVAAPLRLAMLNCLSHYAFFHGSPPSRFHDQRAYAGADRDEGYPALEALARLAPDALVFAGDNAYYDNPPDHAARTVPEMRAFWHRQFALPRVRRVFGVAATYWMKDDHDFRFNDADLTGPERPTPADGIRIFREQVPVTDPADPAARTYRTVRFGRDLQVWFLEGRDYRSPNRMPDGPGKSIWGAEQLAWLHATLRASDATFRLIVSPTPLVGPDGNEKTDNHTNRGGFQAEGEAFFAWLAANGIPPDGCFILCGDRHWKYHARHPSGYEEFSCGALDRTNSRAGVRSGHPDSTDPEGRVRQLHVQREPGGGFLTVELTPAAGGEPARLRFRLHEQDGSVRYEVERARR
ncbi:MAG: alkaline phosphatase D family protein [Opitutaceae bacterium]|nr:alkaline phosphatase D family protein [Opitutaceae bacterium]